MAMSEFRSKAAN